VVRLQPLTRIELLLDKQYLTFAYFRSLISHVGRCLILIFFFFQETDFMKQNCICNNFSDTHRHCNTIYFLKGKATDLYRGRIRTKMLFTAYNGRSTEARLFTWRQWQPGFYLLLCLLVEAKSLTKACTIVPTDRPHHMRWTVLALAHVSAYCTQGC
jgi:hypothetical protein